MLYIKSWQILYDAGTSLPAANTQPRREKRRHAGRLSARFFKTTKVGSISNWTSYRWAGMASLRFSRSNSRNKPPLLGKAIPLNLRNPHRRNSHPYMPVLRPRGAEVTNNKPPQEMGGPWNLFRHRIMTICLSKP